MKCPTCGREIAPPDTECPNCADREAQVKVLTPAERENFQGVTLDSDPTGERSGEGSYSYESRGPHHRVYVRGVSFGGGKTSLWTKLVILAVIGVVVFVILPMFFLFFAAAGLVWFILSLLRR